MSVKCLRRKRYHANLAPVTGIKDWSNRKPISKTREDSLNIQNLEFQMLFGSEIICKKKMEAANLAINETDRISDRSG